MVLRELGSFVALTAILCALLFAVENAELGKVIRVHGERGCRLAGGDFVGIGDITMVSARLALGSSDDRLSLWEVRDPRFGGPNATENGAIVAIVLPDADAADAAPAAAAAAAAAAAGAPAATTPAAIVRRCALHNFPAGVAFHPHGMSLSPDGRTLFVVNHAYGRAGERVEAFDVDVHGEPAAASTAAAAGAEAAAAVVPVSLRWSHAVGRAYFAPRLGQLSGVAALSADELYVTQQRPFADDAALGRANARGRRWAALGTFLAHTLRSALGVPSALLGVPAASVHRCARPRAGAPFACSAEAAASGAAFAGISWDARRGRLLVSDPAARTVLVFGRDARTGALEQRAALATPHRASSIELHGRSGIAYMGAMCPAGHGLAFAHASQHERRRQQQQQQGQEQEQGQGVGVSVASTCGGGVLALVPDGVSEASSGARGSSGDGSGALGVWEVLMQGNERTLLAGVSCACRAGDSHLLLGSWAASGVLVCPIDEDHHVFASTFHEDPAAGAQRPLRSEGAQDLLAPAGGNGQSEL